MLKRVVLLSLLLICLSGCAAGKLVGRPPVIEDNDFATVHLARPSGFAGCGVRMTIDLDYQEFYWLACGQQIAFRVPAGKPITISQTSSTVPDHLQIVPEKGKAYYFENDCNGWACWLQETTQNNFNNVARRCGKEVKVGY